jgi:hypothetical protein
MAVRERDLDANELEALREAYKTIAPIVGPLVPEGQAVEVQLHSALGLLWDPNHWQIVEVLGPEVVRVSDGQNRGVTGTHPTYRCSRCDRHGPWDGDICRICGSREFPDM